MEPFSKAQGVIPGVMKKYQDWFCNFCWSYPILLKRRMVIRVLVYALCGRRLNVILVFIQFYLLYCLVSFLLIFFLAHYVFTLEEDKTYSCRAKRFDIHQDSLVSLLAT